ncbi:MAG: nucleoside triphosphate pyrophosphatase [Gammaproteobacteria bacterium]|nr:nucleoside triphosphate pyrophosphatase [Gammaproteobacteria bacterium]MDJ0871305.1 nucleoside triphosphate pyrophosphatase [Gammaproteobacteria bacterium]
MSRGLILASTSPFRRQLLERLGVPFSTVNPEVDESRLEGESAEDLVRRLAEAKARSVATHQPHAMVIGSDQVAVLGDRILGKPGNKERAVAQLTACAGRRVQFLTGLCVADVASDRVQVDIVPYSVTFRSLSPAQILAYVEREEPYNSAGSFRSEGLGIALFERMSGEDPTALVGLPLIRLVAMLQAAGRDILLQAD